MDVIVILFGVVLGSFYNVVAYRVPRGESLVAPPSHCPQCGHRLGAVDLVPVLSFLWLKGRCRHCGAAISWRYPLVEALTGALFWLGYRLFGITLVTPVFWLVASLVLLAALVGADRRQAVAPLRPAAKAAARAARDENGMTLIETLAAVAILGIVVVAVMGLYTASGREQRDAAAMAEATTLAQSVLEGARYMAVAGALPAVPLQWADFPVTHDGITYDVQVATAPADGSPTLTQVTAHVGWNIFRPSAVDLTTLVTSTVTGGTPTGRGNGGGNGNHFGEIKNGNNDNGNGWAYGQEGGTPPTWDWLALLAQ